MSGFHLGDRRTFTHRQRTVGIVAARNGETVGVTTIDLGGATHLISAGKDVSSSELFLALRLGEDVLAPRDPHYSVAPELSELDLLLGATVQRFAPGHGRIFGQVTALRGRAIIMVTDNALSVTDLVEIVFDETRNGGIANPPLEGADSGALVTTWDGRVVGLLIAGLDQLAFVAPLHAFLAAEGMVHESVLADVGFDPADAEDEEGWRPFRKDIAESRAGIDALGAELQREPSLGLPHLGGEAA